jgi:hypothetical protein
MGYSLLESVFETGKRQKEDLWVARARYREIEGRKKF